MDDFNFHNASCKRIDNNRIYLEMPKFITISSYTTLILILMMKHVMIMSRLNFFGHEIHDS